MPILAPPVGIARATPRTEEAIDRPATALLAAPGVERPSVSLVVTVLPLDAVCEKLLVMVVLMDLPTVLDCEIFMELLEL